MYCGTIQVGFWFGPKSINKVNKQNLPGIVIHVTKPTVYSMTLIEMFFFLFFLKSIKLHVCNNLHHYSGCCVVRELN